MRRCSCCCCRCWWSAERGLLFRGRPPRATASHALGRAGIARTFQHVDLLKQLTVIENVMVGLTARLGRYFPFAPGFGRRTVERQSLNEAEAVLEQTGL